MDIWDDTYPGEFDRLYFFVAKKQQDDITDWYTICVAEKHSYSYVGIHKCNSTQDREALGRRISYQHIKPIHDIVERLIEGETVILTETLFTAKAEFCNDNFSFIFPSLLMTSESHGMSLELVKADLMWAEVWKGLRK